MISDVDLQEQARQLEHAGKMMSAALVSMSDVIEAFNLDPSLKARFMALGAEMAKASTVSLAAIRGLGIATFDVNSGEFR